MDLSKYSKEDLKKSGIYKISNIINKKIYIGSAVIFRKRIAVHKSDFKKQKHNERFQNFVNKYGIKTLVFEILEYVDNLDNLLIREQYFIDFYQSSKSKFGFNICPTAGSVLGVKMPDSHKKASKQRMLGNTIMKGFIHSEETKQLISENSIKFWAENSEKKKEMGEKISKLKKGIPQWINKPHPALGKESPCKGQKRTSEFCKNVSNRMIENNPMKGKILSEERKLKIKEKLSKKINLVDDYGNVIQQFNSIRDCGRLLKLDSSAIAKCCKGIYKHVKGFLFSYS